MFRKKHTAKRLLSLFIFLLIPIISGMILPEDFLAAYAAGRIYYVDFNYSGIETGSSAQPFNSLPNAVSAASFGDKIYIKDGTYPISSSRIQDVEVRNFRPDCQCEALSDSEMLTITVDPVTSGKVYLNAQGIFGDNSLLKITNCKCIKIDGANRMVIDGSAATFNAKAPIVSISAYKNVIEHIVFENIEVRNTTGRGISFLQEPNPSPGNIIIRNNRIHDIAQRAVGGFGNTVYIEGNEIWRAAMSNENQSYGTQGWPGVIQTARGYNEPTGIYEYCKNIVVKNNLIHQCWGEGIIMDSTLGGEISHNKIYDVFSVYIYVGTSKDIVINGNHIFRTTAIYDRKDKILPVANGISFASELHTWGPEQVPITIESLMISNNLIDNAGKGVSFWFDRGNTYTSNSYKNISILHNVLRNLQHTPIHIDDVPAGFNAPMDCQIVNNIIENSGTSKAETYDIVDADVWKFLNNNWTGGLPLVGTHTGSHAGKAGFAGPDMRVGSEPENFQLVNGSANIAAGIGTSAKVDFWNTPRSKEAPSIGLHEYNSVINPPTGVHVQIGQ